MSVEQVFRAYEASGVLFPVLGQRVQATRRTSRGREVIVGVVTLLWCGIEPVFTVRGDDGAEAVIYPTLSDTWAEAQP